MTGCNRRRFLSTVGAGMLAGAGRVAGMSASSEATLRAQVVDYKGDPVPHRRVKLGSKSDSGYQLTTDGKGRFTQEVQPDTIYRIGFYRYETGHTPSEPNGVPLVSSLGRHTTGEGETDLGRLQLDEAQLIEVLALDSDGNPVGGAKAHLTAHGSGGDYWRVRSSSLLTNYEGYVVVEGAPYTGLELVGRVDLSISIPNGEGGAMQYSREFDVQEPLHITAQVGEGLVFEPLDEWSEENSTSETTTQQTTTTTTEQTESTTKTTTQQTTTKQTTTTTTEQTDSRTETTSETETQDEVSRGFFSNENPETEYEFLSDPFFLTFGGFALSILGVLHNMVRR